MKINTIPSQQTRRKTTVPLSLAQRARDPSCRPAGSLCATESQSTALICGNKNVTCSVWTACSFTVLLSERRARPKLDKCVYLWFSSSETKVCPSFISVSVSRPKAKQRLVREVGARSGNPPPALVLSLWVALERRRGSLLAACALFRYTETRRGLTPLFFSPPFESQAYAIVFHLLYRLFTM